MGNPKPGVSEDLSALREIINLQIPVQSARWEVFGTPEYTGGVPGPTDYVTMVAELRLSAPHWLETNKEPTGVTFVAPEAARPWMNVPFRRLMEKNRGANTDLSRQEQCSKFETTLRKTGKPVVGFLCARADQLLLYLTLSES